MAIEIGASEFGERVSLTGSDAEHFLDEVLHPSADARRLEHLERSDETFRRVFSGEPLQDLLRDE